MPPDDHNVLEDRIMARVAALMAEADSRNVERFAAMSKAVDKAETATNYRLAQMNEVREVMAKQQATYVTRDEYLTGHNALINKIETGLEANGKLISAQGTRLDRAEGSGKGASQTISFIAIGISVLVGLFEVFSKFIKTP